MTGPFTPPAPVAPEQAAAAQVLGAGIQLYNLMLAGYTRAYNGVWNNPKATPDKIVAAMGTQAQKVFALSAALAAFLVQAGATGIPTTMPAGWNYQANGDGSVTLTAAAD